MNHPPGAQPRTFSMSTSDSKLRQVYGTEHSWCKAVPGGTGTTTLILLLTKPPDTTLLTTSLQTLQNCHPILRSKLHYDPTSSTFSLLIPPSSSLHLTTSSPSPTPTSFLDLVEHEINLNPWSHPTTSDPDVMHAGSYEVKDGGKRKWVVVIKIHTGVCDRTATVEVMRELMEIMVNGGGVHGEEGEVKLGVEEYVAREKTSKPFWSRGINMLGYSLNSFRLCNLVFVEPGSDRSSRVVRLVLESHQTTKLLQGCRSRGIKLCGALSAAGLIAARLSKGLPDGQWEKYAVATLIDCRKLLEPALSNHDVGFYHSAILNTHDMQGGEELWELAGRTYKSFEDAKSSNKHFSDMADLNFLMCRAIENPGLTPSGSLRTSMISVFEDPVIDETSKSHDELGVEDYLGCASVHGVGPSIAVFDTIRDGKLDCACIYPSPLHSREQMRGVIDNMKKILIDASEI